MVIEECPLILIYPNPAGGRRGEATSFHGRNTMESIMIAHKVPGEERDKNRTCTVNVRVFTNDVWGTSKGPVPPYVTHMSDLSYPAGAPNGGPRLAFPARALQFLVNRCGKIRHLHVMFV